MQSLQNKATTYSFEEFKAEASAYVKAMWQTSDAIDGNRILDCQIHQTTDNPFLPKEYEL